MFLSKLADAEVKLLRHRFGSISRLTAYWWINTAHCYKDIKKLDVCLVLCSPHPKNSPPERFCGWQSAVGSETYCLLSTAYCRLVDIGGGLGYAACRYFHNRRRLLGVACI